MQNQFDELENNSPKADESLEVKAMTSAELLQGALASSELMEQITGELLENPKLAKKLNLDTTDPIQLELEVGRTIQKLESMSGQLTDIIELIAIILVNPKGLVKKYKTVGKVMSQNAAVLDEFENRLDNLTADENMLKVALGYLGKLNLKMNPTYTGSKLVAYLSQLTGIVTEEETAQMQSNTELLDTPGLNIYIIWTLLKDSPELTKEIYETAMQIKEQA